MPDKRKDKKVDKTLATIPAAQDGGEFLVYETEDGQIKLEVRLENETLWLTQKAMAALFGTSTDNISLHLRNIYSEGELARGATTEDFSVVQIENKTVVA